MRVTSKGMMAINMTMDETVMALLMMRNKTGAEEKIAMKSVMATMAGTC